MARLAVAGPVDRDLHSPHEPVEEVGQDLGSMGCDRRSPTIQHGVGTVRWQVIPMVTVTPGWGMHQALVVDC